MVLSLKQSQGAWGGADFDHVFRAEVEQLPHDALPLQQGLSLSSYVSEEPFKLMVISRSEDSRDIHVKAGVFYSGIIAGCSCADDPTPTDVQAEYCDLQFDIDKQSGETRITLLSD